MRTFVLNIIFVSISLSFLLSFNSCRQEIDMDVTDTIEVLPVELITTNISGQVTDNNGKVLEGASVKIREVESLTDVNGYFLFENIKADKNGTHIIVNKSGYHQNRITVYPSLSHNLFSSIILNEETESATLLSWEGGEVKLSDNASVYIAPNTLVYDTDGSNFEGIAHISFQVFDLEKESFTNLIPGELIGINSEKVQVGLIPASAIKISVSDGKLNKLRLAREQTAELEFGISSKYKEEWNGELPMWHFNSNNNRWEEKGKSLNHTEVSFVGEISDFDHWCIADSYEIIQLTGTVKYDNNISTLKHDIQVFSAIQTPPLKSIADSEGHFSTFVPSNSPLEFKVLNECGYIVHESDLGTFSQDVDIQKELTENENCKNVPVEGRLIDCEGNGLSNAYLKISSEENEQFIKSDINGYYEGSFKVCDTAERISLSAFDNTRLISTLSHENLEINQAVNIGSWKVCEGEGYMSLQFKNSYYFLKDEMDFELEESGEMIIEGTSDDVWIECGINYFKGEGTYHIPSELEADFFITVEPLNEDAPKLFPKNTLSLWTYKLTVDNYIENSSVEGTIVGLARDENHDNVDGMMYIRFKVPYVK